MPRCVCVCVSVWREGETLCYKKWERERPQWRETHVVLAQAPRGLVLREKLAYWRGEGWGVLLFILTCSTLSLTRASQLRSCGSSVIYTKQHYRLHEHTGDEHSRKQFQGMLENLCPHVHVSKQGREHTTLLTHVFYLEHKIKLHLEIYKSHLRHFITIQRKMASKNNNCYFFLNK